MGIRHRNLRKAAVLVSSLEPAHADALLAQMTAGQVERLRRAIERLGEIDGDEQQEIIDEFLRLGPLMPCKQPSGIELDDHLPAHLARSPVEAVCAGGERAARPLECLDAASSQALAGFLEREHPQTIAVVVSHLSPQRAAEVLSHLRPGVQVEVARRLVDLDQTDPEIIREVERGLESWLRVQLPQHPPRTAGSAALGKILEAAGPRMKQHILTHLDRDPRSQFVALPREAPPPLTFAEVEQLDAAALTVVLHHAQGELLVLALAGARAEFADRVFELFPAEEAAALRESLLHLGPTRLSDVEEAQRELAELAHQLEVRGEIAPLLRGRGRLSVAV